MNKLMVVGIIIAGEQVLLIKKNRHAGYKGDGRPAQHHGLLNGIGGVVKDDESAIACLVRCCEKETSLKTAEEQWFPFHELQGNGVTVLFAKLALSPKQLLKVLSPSDEEVCMVHIDRLPQYKTVSNIQWLVQMARDPSHNFSMSEEASGHKGAVGLTHGGIILENTAWNETPSGSTPVKVDPTHRSEGAPANATPPAGPDGKGNTSEGSENNSEGSNFKNSENANTGANSASNSETEPNPPAAANKAATEPAKAAADKKKSDAPGADLNEKL